MNSNLREIVRKKLFSNQQRDFFFKMGSTFSIENDTKEEYYMTYYNCQAALWGTVGAVVGLGLIATGGFTVAWCLAAVKTKTVVAAASITGTAMTGNKDLHVFHFFEIVLFWVGLIFFIVRCLWIKMPDFRRR